MGTPTSCSQVEGAAHVCVPTRRGQLDLRYRVAHATEWEADGQTEMPGQLGRLVESALTLAPRIQRHRHDPLDAIEQIASTLAHEEAQAPGDRVPPVIFQCMNDLPERAVVFADGASSGDDAHGAPAPRTPLRATTRHAP